MKNWQGVGRILAFLLLCWPLYSGQAAARGYDDHADVTVEIVSDERGPLAKYDAGYGGGRTRRSYVVARDDERYRIWVRNGSDERVGLVIAVDGRNIISGDRSDLAPHERMYILGPYQSAEYEGWRTGRDRVNRFYFTGMSDSYAAAWGDYSAMGVIAVAVYRGRHEYRHEPREPWDALGRQGAPPPRGDRPMAQREAPGTGYGESEWSPSRTVRFTPEDHPVAREFIKYEWYSTLCKRGIIDCRQREHRNRFWPGPGHGDGYAPPPPRWPYQGR